VRATQGLITVGCPSSHGDPHGSIPNDPNPANDQASASCAVVTGLIILC